jgi:DNA polymerase III delta prime subunit
MSKRRDFKAAREIRTRLNTANDDALLKLSAKAMEHIKNILKADEKTGQTAAYHNIAQKYERLEDSIEKLNESIKFSSESRVTIKRDWQEARTSDAKDAREALFMLLSSCEALDNEDISGRVKSESKNIDKTVSELKKIKKTDKKSCEAVAKLSLKLERSLRNLDNIIGGTEHPGENFDTYSKFSNDLEDLPERTRRLDESLKFFEDPHTKEDWKNFMDLDLERTRASIKAAHASSSVLIKVATR